MTTATALCTQAANRFKDPNNRVISATQWLAYLNQCYSDVNESSPLLPWLEQAEALVSVTAGSRSGNLPANTLTINWAYDVTDDYRLIGQEGRGDQWHQDHLRSETGQPVTYRLRGGTIELFPTPSITTSVAVECMTAPGDLNAQVTATLSHAGAAAGNLTMTGVHLGDIIVSVLGVKTTDQSVHDFTSEFMVFATNTLDNTGGTATTGYTVVLTYYTPGSGDSPVHPQQYHSDMIDGMLGLAYLDEGNQPVYQVLWAKFEASIKQMVSDVLLARTETNVPIRDVFWS